MTSTACFQTSPRPERSCAPTGRSRLSVCVHRQPYQADARQTVAGELSWPTMGFGNADFILLFILAVVRRA